MKATLCGPSYSQGISFGLHFMVIWTDSPFFSPSFFLAKAFVVRPVPPSIWSKSLASFGAKVCYQANKKNQGLSNNCLSENLCVCALVCVGGLLWVCGRKGEHGHLKTIVNMQGGPFILFINSRLGLPRFLKTLFVIVLQLHGNLFLSTFV